MIIKKYSKIVILTLAFISVSAQLNAMNLDSGYNLGSSTIKSFKDYTYLFAASAFETVKIHKNFIYCALGITALNIAAYKSFPGLWLQNWQDQIKEKNFTLQRLVPCDNFYFISNETRIDEHYFNNPFTNEQSIFLNVFTNDEFIERVYITKETQTILLDYRRQNKEYFDSLVSSGRVAYYGSNKSNLKKLQRIVKKMWQSLSFL